MVIHATGVSAEMPGGGSVTAADRPIILCFVAYYLPGYRSGGPVRTIANFVDHLGDEFDIRIVTRDRDALVKEPYPDVTIDEWNTVGKAQVFYASDRTLTLWGITRLLRQTPHDILYLNSFFSFRFATLPLLARRLGMASRRPCVVAPRGEFSQGAIGLKAWKKRPYLAASRMMGLYAGLRWQASSDFEVGDISREFGDSKETPYVAPDLPPSVQQPSFSKVLESSASPRPLQLIFLSRISPMKNLDFLLEVLARVTSAVVVKLYGPLREPEYWQQCKSLMELLPSHIKVEYRGEAEPPNVPSAFASADLFVFPTRGENYGHVILESLTAGTPVLLSDQTPWPASDDGAVEIVGLDTPDLWVDAIERWAAMDSSQRAQMSGAARAYAERYLVNSAALGQNRALFTTMMPGRQRGF